MSEENIISGEASVNELSAEDVSTVLEDISRDTDAQQNELTADGSDTEESDNDEASHEEPEENDVSPVEAGDTAPDQGNELDKLRAEVAELRAELERKESEQERILTELGEFNRLFPNIAIKDLPNAVWDRVDGGLPLCAAYALYEKEESMRRHRAEAVNTHNAQRSAGKAGKDTASEYFSPEEVRCMTQKEVHENYSVIRRSMKHWR